MLLKDGSMLLEDGSTLLEDGPMLLEPRCTLGGPFLSLPNLMVP